MAGMPMIGRLIERVRQASSLDALVLATSWEPDDDGLAEYGTSLGVPVVRGSEADVLSRFLTAADRYDAQAVVRLTGDNPLVDDRLVDLTVRAFLDADPPVDYVTTADPNSGFPLGLTVEIVRTAALRATYAERCAESREHVTWHVRQRLDKFRQLVVRAPVSLPTTPVTVDTLEDFLRVEALFANLSRKWPRFPYTALATADA